MRKLMGLCLLFVMIACVAGFAADKKLNDRQMDAITAGIAGGVVVGGSDATITENYYTTVTGKAGNDSTTLNFVNAAGGQVGIGTNIFTAPLFLLTWDNLRQLNVIDQSETGGAFLGGYATVVAGFDATYLAVEHADLTTLDIGVHLTPTIGGSLDYLNANIDDLTYFNGTGFFAFHGIDVASAGFVVADGSSLTYHENAGVLVDGGALQNVNAINIVNSANAQVGIGLNLATMDAIYLTPTFTQINRITQTKSTCGCGL